jgi:competence protein ComEC
MLFTADVEADALIRMGRETGTTRVDLIKVPHHGSASSIQPEWLERVNPRYAVISVGRHNAYGHPASRVLQTYADRGIPMYRTDRDGAVWVTGKISAPVLQIDRATEQQAQRVPLPGCLWDCERSNWERMINRWRG